MEPYVRIQGSWSRSSDLRCSFCWKPRGAVRHLIAGPGSESNRPLICDECVDLCAEIIAEEIAAAVEPPNGSGANSK